MSLTRAISLTTPRQQVAGIVRRSSRSVVTWRRAQMILLSAQWMDAPRMAQVTFTSEDRVGGWILYQQCRRRLMSRRAVRGGQSEGDLSDD